MTNRQTLLKLYQETREQSKGMVAGLEAEEFRIQPFTEASPPWWNLGHTSWFFAVNILEAIGNSTHDDQRYHFILNSYYKGLGSHLLRSRRGLLSRPTTQEILAYRSSVDKRMTRFIARGSVETLSAHEDVIRIGCRHERQHQELFYTEVKAIYAENETALRPTFHVQKDREQKRNTPVTHTFVPFSTCTAKIGNRTKNSGWDNEYPLHHATIAAFALGNRPVTCGEFMEFIDDGGYKNSLLWLSDGWDAVQDMRHMQHMRPWEQWEHPLYWEQVDGVWYIWTLNGMKELDSNEPVCHVSFFEADAFARWKGNVYQREYVGVRLPTEEEWEYAADTEDIRSAHESNTCETHTFHPRMERAEKLYRLHQMYGDVWEWTGSAYRPYPGYKPFQGALTEYNGKFMNGQYVLKGGSCVTHSTETYISNRNFWEPKTRFQFTGFRLAKSI